MMTFDSLLSLAAWAAILAFYTYGVWLIGRAHGKEVMTQRFRDAINIPMSAARKRRLAVSLEEAAILSEPDAAIEQEAARERAFPRDPDLDFHLSPPKPEDI